MNVWTWAEAAAWAGLALYCAEMARRGWLAARHDPRRQRRRTIAITWTAQAVLLAAMSALVFTDPPWWVGWATIALCVFVNGVGYWWGMRAGWWGMRRDPLTGRRRRPSLQDWLG